MKRTDAMRNVGNLFDPGNPAAGIKGTVVDHTWANAVQEELVNLLMGLNPVAVLSQDNSDLHQIADALSTALAAKVSSNGGTMSANPTVALGVATKQYVDGIISLAASGYWQSPGGLILQWGKGTAPATGTTTSTLIVTFPVAFPNAPLGAWVTTAGHANSSTGGNPAGGAISLSTTSFQAVLDVLNQSITFNQTCDFYWFAIGH